MILPTDFIFNQNNLQDYADCPRRFELKHVLKQSWPAVLSEPLLEVEAHQHLGQNFHQLVQQYELGLEQKEIERSIHNADLLSWWRNYLEFAPKGLKANRFVEHTLSIPFHDFRLLSQYDLILYDNHSKCLIVDWKTSRIRLPSNYLHHRMQSIIYLYVLAEVGSPSPKLPTIKPESIKMVYWFPQFPHESEIINYSSQEHNQSGELLKSLVMEINQKKLGEFAITENEKMCRFCNYRSLCQRGIQAGNWQEQEAVDIENQISPLDLDFDQIKDIAY